MAGPGKSKKNPGVGPGTPFAASPCPHCRHRNHGEEGSSPLCPQLSHTGTGRREKPALGMFWNCPSSVFSPGWSRCDGGGASLVPVPWGSAEPASAKVLQRGSVFSIFTQAGSCWALLLLMDLHKVLPCTFLYISYIYIYIYKILKKTFQNPKLGNLTSPPGLCPVLSHLSQGGIYSSSQVRPSLSPAPCPAQGSLSPALPRAQFCRHSRGIRALRGLSRAQGIRSCLGAVPGWLLQRLPQVRVGTQVLHFLVEVVALRLQRSAKLLQALDLHLQPLQLLVPQGFLQERGTEGEVKAQREMRG